MNIIEAVKSNKRFRRKGTTDWKCCSGFSQEFCMMFQCRESFLADDWEVEKTIIISRRDLLQAYNLTHFHQTGYNFNGLSKFLELDE